MSDTSGDQPGNHFDKSLKHEPVVYIIPFAHEGVVGIMFFVVRAEQ